jgi:hypothetical protein
MVDCCEKGVAMKTKVLAAALPGLLFASAANAQSVSVWTNQPTAANSPTISTAGTLPSPDLTTTVSGINFTDGPGFNSDATTVGQFLGNPALSSATLDNSYFLFTGTIFLTAGANAFTIAHDDGLQLSLDGGIGLVVDAAVPTSPTTTPFTINAPSTGTYNYTLSYGECCGGPAVLQWLYPTGAPVGQAPEPATWAMMLLGFGGIGMVMRGRRRRQELAQIA